MSPLTLTLSLSWFPRSVLPLSLERVGVGGPGQGNIFTFG